MGAAFLPRNIPVNEDIRRKAIDVMSLQAFLGDIIFPGTGIIVELFQE